MHVSMTASEFPMHSIECSLSKCFQQHAVLPRYPNSGLEKNHCRNPNGAEKPWCYTMDKAKRWEYCDVSCPSAEGVAKVLPGLSIGILEVVIDEMI